MTPLANSYLSSRYAASGCNWAKRDLRVFAGFLKGHKVPLGDGVDQNDVPFLSSFPYVAPPHAGYDSQIKRIEPPHPPTPAQPALAR